MAVPPEPDPGLLACFRRADQEAPRHRSPHRRSFRYRPSRRGGLGWRQVGLGFNRQPYVNLMDLDVHWQDATGLGTPASRPCGSGSVVDGLEAESVQALAGELRTDR